MKFKYREYFSEEGIVVRRPVVTLAIIGPAGKVRWDALIDTGSDITLLPGVIAEDLGIDLAAAQESTVRGVGNQPIDTRDCHLVLELSDGSLAYRWEAEVSLVIDKCAESHLALLGHRGCLDYFSASFEADTYSVELLPAKRYPGTVVSLG